MSTPSSPPADIPPTEVSPLLRKNSGERTLPHSSITDASIVPTPADGPEEVEAERTEARNYEGMPEVRRRMMYIMPALAVGIFLSSADQTIVVSSYGKIGSDLKALKNTSWIATAYLLTLTSFQPLYGKLSDIFGRKPLLIWAYVIFGLGCMLCGLAQTMGQLIAARAFAGIGGGGMSTVVSIVLSDIVPLRERGTFQGYMNIVWAAGAGIGAPLGGFLADTIGWKWAFLGQAPLTILAILSVYFFLYLPEPEDANWRTKLRRIDFLGAFALVASVFSLLLGLDRGSSISWASTLTIVLLCASAVLFLGFGFVEAKVATEPFAPGRIIFERSLLACYLCNFFSFGGWFAVIFYLPLYYQAVDGLSAAESGTRLIPAIIAGVAGSLFAGFVMKKTGRYYALIIAAYMGLLWGFLPIILFTGLISNSTWGSVVGLTICGFGNGVGLTATLIALIAQASIADQAVATACSYLFRSLGSVLGVSISSTVVQQSLRLHLRAALSNGKEVDKIVERARQSLDYIKTLDPATREVVRHYYGTATRTAFIVNACVVAGAAVSAFCVRECKLSR